MNVFLRFLLFSDKEEERERERDMGVGFVLLGIYVRRKRTEHEDGFGWQIGRAHV